MSDRYTEICHWLLEQEDAGLTGVVVNLQDGGGLTRFGLTSVNNPSCVADGFYEMNRDSALTYARNFYKLKYWAPVRGDEIQSDEVAASLFSFAVNDGTARAIKLLQRALGVQDDGIMGPATLGAANRLDPATVAQALRNQQANFYRQIAQTHPVVARDLNGLLRRAGRVYP